MRLTSGARGAAAIVLTTVASTVLVAVLLGLRGGSGPTPISWAGSGASAQSRSLVVIGVPGVGPRLLDNDQLPALDALLPTASVAALNVTAIRTPSCAVDGWLSLSAGGRAGATRDSTTACPPVPDVVDGRVGRWSDLVATAKDQPYDAIPGSLSAAVRATGQCVGAVGPGAALVAADGSGAVAHYASYDSTTLASALSVCPTTIVDAGALTVPSGTTDASTSVEQTAAIASRVQQILASAPTTADVIVAGIADDGSRRLRMMLATGPDVGPGLLWSASTRQPGLVQLPDLAATIAAHAGAALPASFTGSVLERIPGASSAAAGADRLDVARATDSQARTVEAVVGPAIIVDGVVLVLLLLAGFRVQATSTVALGLVRAGLVFLGCFPVAAFLVDLSTSLSVLGLLGLLGFWMVVVAAVALAGPWRRSRDGSAMAVAVITVAVVGADVVTGSRLQLLSLLGLKPLQGGRFYGMGNVAFAVFVAALYVVLISVTSRYVAAGRRHAAAWAVVVLGGAGVLVDAAPMWGADAGGPPALLPGLAFLVLAVLGVRLTWTRAASIALGTVGVVVAVAVLDWLRPASARTHLGRFVQTVVDGGGADIVGRKLSGVLDSLTGTSVFAWGVPLGMVLMIWVVARPESVPARPLRAASLDLPTLRPGLVALTVTSTIGLLLNDSGIAIPATVWLLAIPLVAACCLPRRETWSATGVETERAGPATRRGTASRGAAGRASPNR